ncbi:MAG: lamin tail domain-containing protein, partial [Bacteroidales bacterium]
MKLYLLLISSILILLAETTKGEFICANKFNLYSPCHTTIYDSIPQDNKYRNTRQSTLLINEFMALNSKTCTDNKDNYSDWIEIYNPNNSEINLKGWSISDKSSRPKLHIFKNDIRIAPKGFLLLWANKDIDSKQSKNINIKLSGNGESIYLYKPDGNISDKITFGPQIADISYGRVPDGGNAWVYFDKPTPNGKNHSEGINHILPNPTANIRGGYYKEAINIELSCKEPNTEIRFTTNGSNPNQESALYSNPIIIDKTTTLRFRSFKDKYIPSLCASSTYIFDTKPSIATICITAEKDDLWGKAGIYDNPKSDIKVASYFEFFD